MGRPSDEIVNHIAVSLFGVSKRDDWVIPRCPLRSNDKRIAFEMENDFSHSKHRHSCELCQCGNYAGEGTKGEFWGSGPEWHEVGHFGVGYCREHEKFLLREKWKTEESLLEVARKHRDAIMNRGIQARQNPHLIAEYEAEQANRQEVLVKNMEEMKSLTDELLSFMRNTRKKETQTIVLAIKSLESALKEHDFNDTKVRDKYYNDLAETILVASELTESAGGRIIPMTDKTKFLLADKLLNSVSKLNLDEYRMGKDSYVHVDEIKKRIPQILKLISVAFKKVYEFHLNYDQEKHNMKEFLENTERDCTQKHMEIWASMKTGSK